ncbi:MAG: hypothetical protein RH942_07400 [Kiloniellaceae bacterium]
MADGMQPGRIPCPDCGFALALPIEAVLAGQAIVCVGCGLELHVHQEDSQAALAALGRWYQETAPARDAAATAGIETGEMQSQSLSRRQRRPRR